MAEPGTTTCEHFGNINGVDIERYTLTNESGMSVSILTYGAIIQALSVPNRSGSIDNVVLGFGQVEDYAAKSPYFGAIVGRYANRTASGRFELDGVAHEIPINNPPNALHGGPAGFDRKVWTAEPVPREDGLVLAMHLESPDGDQGFPGNLRVTVEYALQLATNTLSIEYRASTDAPTVINLSNHSYFNLSGEGSGDILRHVMMLNASHYLPIDDNLIPTAEVAPVRSTPFDFTEAHIIGERINQDGNEQLAVAGGYDHCWVFDSPGTRPPWVARVVDPVSGRVLEVDTDQPGVQFYSGNFLDGSFAGIGGHVYGHRSGFCLETQHFPDSPNQPSFPSTVLRPGELFHSRTAFRFGVVGRDQPKGERE